MVEIFTYHNPREALDYGIIICAIARAWKKYDKRHSKSSGFDITSVIIPHLLWQKSALLSYFFHAYAIAQIMMP